MKDLMCPVISRHDSHFLLLLDLLLFLLVVLHYLQPLSLDQAALLDVELFFCLQVEAQFTQQESLRTFISFFFAPTTVEGYVSFKISNSAIFTNNYGCN